MRPDPAFLWETEAIRESTDRRAAFAGPDGTQVRRPTAGPTWATLRGASEWTGIPVETIRKWARRGTIPTYLDESTNHRMVGVEGVMSRASELGRDLSIGVDATPTPPTQLPERPAGPDRESGTMIVPIAAWDKMLMQLGNLHEAGQQLAEARERAAKAETEATFLKERLAEMRVELGDAAGGQHAVPASPPHSPPVPEPSSETRPVALWRYLYRGWRHRRR